MNNSLIGNTSLWNYTWPASVINQTNTSVSIFDVDADYYTLSFGVNKYINFSLDTGDITTIGDIAVDDIVINTITFEQNTSALLCNEANRGKIYYNNDTNKFYGCNSTAWDAFN